MNPLDPRLSAIRARQDALREELITLQSAAAEIEARLDKIPMKTTHITLSNQPNRRAEFWSDSDEGPVMVYHYRDKHPVIIELAEQWLMNENYCVHICSGAEEIQVVP